MERCGRPEIVRAINITYLAMKTAEGPLTMAAEKL
jgi:hypothetical protein